MAITVFKPMDDFNHIIPGPNPGDPFVNLISEWLEVNYIKHTIEAIIIPDDTVVQGMNYIHHYPTKRQIGWNYTFESPRDAMLFKLRWV